MYGTVKLFLLCSVPTRSVRGRSGFGGTDIFHAKSLWAMSVMFSRPLVGANTRLILHNLGRGALRLASILLWWHLIVMFMERTGELRLLVEWITDFVE